MERTVEYEREAVEDLLGKPACHCISNRNWYSFLKLEIFEIYTDWVLEFYSNMELVSSASLKTFVRGKWINISVANTTEVLDIPIGEDCDYPISEDSQVPIDYNMIGTTLCGE